MISDFSFFQISQELGIEAPIRVSMKQSNLNNVFGRIVSAAEHPHLSIPETETRKNRKKYRQLFNRSLTFVSGMLCSPSLPPSRLKSHFQVHLTLVYVHLICICHQITVGAAAAVVGLAAYRAYAARRSSSS